MKKKILVIFILLFTLSCTRGSISDKQIFLSSNITSKTFEVTDKTYRMRIILSGNIKEGQVSIVLVDSQNNLLINEVIQDRFKFSRVINHPAKGEWLIRGKFENGKGYYKVKIILE